MAAAAALSLSSPPCLSSSASSSCSVQQQQRFTLRIPSLNLRSSTRPHRSSIKALSSPAPSLTQDALKKLAADKAVEYVRSGMVLGLGTGSTAAFVVAKLGELLKSGQLKDIVGVPTSKRTQEQAASLGIPLSVLDDHPKLDLAIDGADEVDPNLDLVKGRGGALLREKMVEAASDKFVVVVDDSKLVTGLGGSGLAMPVEVVQFCWKYNLVRLQELFNAEGCEAKLRLDGGKPYVTDNMNYIVDLYFKTPIKDSEAAGREISALEGVVEHGLFLGMTTAVIIAGKEGAWQLYEEGKLLELVDPELDDFPEEEIIRYIKVAFFCTQAAANRRPLMSQVIEMLSRNVRINEKQLTAPGYFQDSGSLSGFPFSNKKSSESSTSYQTSSVPITITQVTPR